MSRSRTRRSRSWPRFRARKRVRPGGQRFYYQNWVTDGGLPRMTSHGIKVWRLNINFTTGRWSFDTPGPGAIYGGRR